MDLLPLARMEALNRSFQEALDSARKKAEERDRHIVQLVNELAQQVQHSVELQRKLDLSDLRQIDDERGIKSRDEEIFRLNSLVDRMQRKIAVLEREKATHYAKRTIWEHQFPLPEAAQLSQEFSAVDDEPVFVEHVLSPSPPECPA